MNTKITKILFGDTEIKEYATVTIDNDINEKVYLNYEKTTIDISQTHWLLCLDPIVFGIWITEGKEILPNKDAVKYNMRFTASANNISRETVANLELDFFDKIESKNGTLILLKLCKSKISHISNIKARLLFHKFYKKPKLSFDQLKAFAAAYSYPRRVSIISFKQGEYYNIFPMDLLGYIEQSGNYVFGLRHTNTALSKIIESKKIAVCDVSYKYKDVIYQLGSHHGKAPSSVESLPFKVINSKDFGFYIPEWADSYKEINIVETINLGSHMLLWGEAQNECVLKSPTSRLFHIHYLHYLYQKRKGSAYPLI